MITEHLLDRIRQGKAPIRFGDDGLPLAMHENEFTQKRFLSAVCRGYMELYESKKAWMKYLEGRNG